MPPPKDLAPVSILKPLKGCDETTEQCLRSWFEQSYQGGVQLLFGVASADDPVCTIVERLMREHPGCNASLSVCSPLAGANLKVSKLMLLEREARHEFIVISDADVKVPPDFLEQAVAALQAPKAALVNCFYQLANPAGFAMHWEAVAINADFWSQVLQSQTLKPLDFALGAVMVTRREWLGKIGGLAGLIDCLADDYQLGHRIAEQGGRISLCPVVVECRSGPMSFAQVWKHQLRWARTIRVCQPLPYFFSILSNSTFWPLLWLGFCPGPVSAGFAGLSLLVRVAAARDLQKRLTLSAPPAVLLPIPLIKDLLQVPLWVLAFLGNKVEWRGERMRLQRDGTLVRA